MQPPQTIYLPYYAQVELRPYDGFRVVLTYQVIVGK
jgi:hypothetical protein